MMCAPWPKALGVGKRLAILLAVLLAVGLGGFALIRLAGAGATEFRVEGPVLHMSGPVSGAAADRLQRLLEENPSLSVLALGDMPGADSVMWATGMGRLIRAAGLETRAEGVVVNDALLLFLGGATREIAGGQLVLQSDAMQRRAGVAVDSSFAAQAEREKFIAAMLGSAAFASAMAQTRAQRDSYVLTADDMLRHGLLGSAQQ